MIERKSLEIIKEELENYKEEYENVKYGDVPDIINKIVIPELDNHDKFLKIDLLKKIEQSLYEFKREIFLIHLHTLSIDPNILAKNEILDKDNKKIYSLFEESIVLLIMGNYEKSLEKFRILKDEFLKAIESSGFKVGINEDNIKILIDHYLFHGIIKTLKKIANTSREN